MPDQRRVAVANTSRSPGLGHQVSVTCIPASRTCIRSPGLWDLHPAVSRTCIPDRKGFVAAPEYPDETMVVLRLSTDVAEREFARGVRQASNAAR